MELIYIWINQTKNKIINDCGVCFNKAYDINFDKNSHVLNIKKDHENIGLLTDEIITGVSAIVGNNGSGKTTILDYIFNLSLMQAKKPTSGNERIRSEKETIQIFVNNSVESEKIYVYHNLTSKIKLELENLCEDDITECDINLLNHEDYIKTYFNDLHPNSTSRIFLTNSGQKSNFTHEFGDGKEHNASLNPKTIENLSYIFYSSKTQMEFGYNVNNLFDNFQKFVIRSRSTETFQSLLDIRYFNNLAKKNKDSLAKKIKSINLSVTSILNNSKEYLTGFSQKALGADKEWESDMKKEIEKFITYSPQDEWGFIKSNQIEDMLKKFRLINNNFEKSNIISTLLINLLFELRCCGVISDGEIDLLKKKNQIKELKKVINFNILNYNDEYLKSYYKKAMKEIEEFEDVLSATSCIGDNLGIIKLPCDSHTGLNEDGSEKSWIKVYEYIEKYTNSGSFFVLKYLNVDIEDMSSGERAILNFFSWLNMIPFFDLIKGLKNGVINRNVIILIDEIDLYCHPEWQRRFINVFLKELKEEFAEKEVQIIFTTHSPIILSDIPNDNVIYLKSGKIANEKRETFAQNIYTLYNDAFFLEDTMGERSKKIITEVNDNLLDLESDNQKKYLNPDSYKSK
ncbi:AAA family ATPase, partial [Acetobacterium sp.]|uniref:AAA family ATPase n=1 Tax=Acetobacterium sp. TaxID=1872094 RepID=UPI002F3EAB0D